MIEVIGAGHGVLEVSHKSPAKNLAVQDPLYCSHMNHLVYH